MRTRFDRSKIEMVEKVYYWNARLNGKTAVLSGPFLTAAEAEMTADAVSPAFLVDQPEARRASFGVMQVNAPGCGEGRYNHLLPARLLGNLAINTGLAN
jgi:hypothetical protein